MSKINVKNKDQLLLIGFAIVVALAPVLFAPIGGGYPDLLQKFAIFGVFAIGFNILFGLTGYLSFGHAAFLGVGSYTAVWTFKLLTMNVIPALILSTLFEGYQWYLQSMLGVVIVLFGNAVAMGKLRLPGIQKQQTENQ